eukprot:COSAG03_NODE_20610_length_316_cov_1.239631_1_plen_52_part_01
MYAREREQRRDEAARETEKTMIARRSYRAAPTWRAGAPSREDRRRERVRQKK